MSTIITVDDVRKAGICVPGLRSWCEQNGIDLKTAIRDGISSDVLVSTGNQGLLDRILESREAQP